jgi:hypothetical protein
MTRNVPSGSLKGIVGEWVRRYGKSRPKAKAKV